MKVSDWLELQKDLEENFSGDMEGILELIATLQQLLKNLKSVNAQHAGLIDDDFRIEATQKFNCCVEYYTHLQTLKRIKHDK